MGDFFKYGSLYIFLIVYGMSLVVWFRYGTSMRHQKIRFMLLQVSLLLLIACGAYFWAISQQNPVFVLWIVVGTASLMGIMLLVFWFVMVLDIFAKSK